MINDLTTWYYSIRFVLSFAAAAGVFGLLIRKKRHAAVTVVFPFVILAVSYIVLTLFPAEKWLLRFDTPQEAFRYYSRMNILRIDERENGALIVAETHTNDTEKTQEGGGYTFYILTKQNGGWSQKEITHCHRTKQNQFFSKKFTSPIREIVLSFAPSVITTVSRWNTSVTTETVHFNFLMFLLPMQRIFTMHW